MSEPHSRKIEVKALTRVEGEGALRVQLRGDEVTGVELAIYEPPRFFEALLRGRPIEEVPDITARICGICPVAYQMTSIHAMENALGVEVTPEIRSLRRLLYCGEWIESHGVHIHLLHIPDFFGCSSSIELAKKYPQEVSRGLRLKKHGNELLEVLGGRAVHPINVAVGGFFRAPARSRIRALIEDFQWGLDAAVETAHWVATFEFPDFAQPYEMVALVHEDEYPMNEGRIESTDGLSIHASEYETSFEERHIPHSTALQSVKLPGETNYHVGPLARVNLNRQRLSPTAQQVMNELPLKWPCFNPYQSIVARAVEVIHAYEEALERMREYEPFAPERIAYEPRRSEGVAVTEAPRGLIYHRYRMDDEGKVSFAKIVPPTSQNQGQIEADLRQFLPSILHHDDATMAMECEKLIRCYDPCISCATHFLNLQIDRK